MSTIDVTIPNPTFTVVKPATGVDVTTPTNQTIAVNVGTATVTVENKPQAITVNTGGVVSSIIDNTDELPEGVVNLYFTNARADARVQAGIAAIDYPVDSVNGKTNTVVLTTTDIGEGTNLYYTDARFDSRLATKTTTNLAEGTNLYYTEQRVEDHEFSELKVDSFLRINTVNAAVGTTAEFTLDSFDATLYATVHYRIQIKNSTNYQFLDLALVQNGTASTFVVYADIRTAGNLATFNVDIVGGQLRVRATPINASTSFKAVRTAVIA